MATRERTRSLKMKKNTNNLKVFLTTRELMVKGIKTIFIYKCCGIIKNKFYKLKCGNCLSKIKFTKRYKNAYAYKNIIHGKKDHKEIYQNTK